VRAPCLSRPFFVFALDGGICRRPSHARARARRARSQCTAVPARAFARGECVFFDASGARVTCVYPLIFFAACTFRNNTVAYMYARTKAFLASVAAARVSRLSVHIRRLFFPLPLSPLSPSCFPLFSHKLLLLFHSLFHDLTVHRV
jgi:hypothetical protein